MDDKVRTGGCQCGAVRYRADAPLSNAHICHCRMCQKAAGNYFLPLGSVEVDNFHVTRGEVSWFFSSDIVRRGFCSRCGTPMIYDPIGSGHIAIALGSLDRPQDVVPEWQSDTEMAMPFFAALSGLRANLGEGDATREDQARYETIRLSSHQHPDHDTAEWPNSRGSDHD